MTSVWCLDVILVPRVPTIVPAEVGLFDLTFSFEHSSSKFIMAADKNEEETLTLCSVCFDTDVSTRKLSVCTHLFCEPCISNYLKSLNKEFECPVCKQENTGPAKLEDIQNWFASLEINHARVQNGKDEKGSEDLKVCVRCHENDKTTTADRYCFECQEMLCEVCCRIGHGFKQLQNHEIISIEAALSDIKEREIIRKMSDYLVCRKHPGNELRLLCRADSMLCCSECRETIHRSCNRVVSVNECVDENRTREEAQDLLVRLSNLTDLSEAIVRVKNENETVNKKNAERIVEEIQELRRKVNDVFDVLQDSVNQQCKGLTKSYYLVDQDDIGELQETIKTLDMSRTLLTKSLELAPPNLVFILVQSLRKIAEEHETDVLELRNSCTRYAMELNVNDLLSKLQQIDLNEASEIATVIGKKSTVSLPAYPNRRLIRYCDIDMVGYHTRRKYQDALYSGMATLPDDRMVLADNATGDCCLISTEYKVIYGLNLVTLAGKHDKNIQPRSVTYTKDDVAAVSVPAEKKIYFVSAQEKLSIIGDVCTTYEPFALCSLRNDEIAISWSNPVAFGILSFSKCYRFVEKVYFDRDKSGRVMKSFLYMAVDEGRAHVVQPCNVDKAVYCFDYGGNPKFTYKHPELTRPLGVAIDNDGGIYICDEDHYCIHVVSPVGHPARVIVNDRLLYPVAVTYKRNCSELVVANKDGDKHVRLSVFKFET